MHQRKRAAIASICGAVFLGGGYISTATANEWLAHPQFVMQIFGYTDQWFESRAAAIAYASEPYQFPTTSTPYCNIEVLRRFTDPPNPTWTVTHEILSTSTPSDECPRVNVTHYQCKPGYLWDVLEKTCIDAPPRYLLMILGDATVQPNGLLSGLVASVKDANDAPVANALVEISAKVLARSGFHEHGTSDTDGHDTARPRGRLRAPCTADAVQCPPGDAAVTVTTNHLGQAPFEFQAPAPAGIHELVGRCIGRECEPAEPHVIDVRVPDLVEVTTADTMFRKIEGLTTRHPRKNNYLQETARSILEDLGREYFAAYGEGLVLNDASLEWGGLFDVDPVPWSVPHKEHRCGRAIDIRGDGHKGLGAIPASRDRGFRRMAEPLGIAVKSHPCVYQKAANGTQVLNCDNAHYHLWLLGKEGKETSAIVTGSITCADLP